MTATWIEPGKRCSIVNTRNGTSTWPPTSRFLPKKGYWVGTADYHVFCGDGSAGHKRAYAVFDLLEEVVQPKHKEFENEH